MPIRPIETPFSLEERQTLRYGLVPAECVDLLPPGLDSAALVPEPLRPSMHLMPRLLDLRSCSPTRADALFARLAEDAERGEPCIAPLWIDSAADREAMVGQWERVQLWRVGARSMWLRAFDPRVLLHLPRVLGHARWQRLAVGWRGLCVHMAGQWVALDPADPGLLASPARAKDGDEQVTGALERIEIVNRTLALLGCHDAHSLLDYAAEIEKLVVDARSDFPTLDAPSLASKVADLLRPHLLERNRPKAIS